MTAFEHPKLVLERTEASSGKPRMSRRRHVFCGKVLKNQIIRRKIRHVIIFIIKYVIN